MKASPASVRFGDLEAVCTHYFGTPRRSNGSHVVYTMLWAGDPRVNIQNDNGSAKPYQVRQVIKAIDRLAALHDSEEGPLMSDNHYTYRVTWSPEDGEYVATVAEFGSLSWLDTDPTAALSKLRSLVADVVADLRASGDPVPEPLADRHYSGEFRLRIPPSLHRALAIEAAEQGISLNRLVSAKVAG